MVFDFPYILEVSGILPLNKRQLWLMDKLEMTWMAMIVLVDLKKIQNSFFKHK